jgi:hypothetical protein
MVADVWECDACGELSSTSFPSFPTEHRTALPLEYTAGYGVCRRAPSTPRRNSYENEDSVGLPARTRLHRHARSRGPVNGGQC